MDKIYLGGEQAEVGNVRETFFLNQMQVNHDVVSSSVSDFRIGDCTFEIGGRKKGKKQVEFGSGNILPLRQFGFEY